MNELTIKYYGHSCFSAWDGETTVVFDPYEPGYVPGLRPLELSADAVFCSHDHGDHNYTAAVKLTGGKKPEFDTITCPHDDAGGKKRGMNTIHIVTLAGMRLAHMGDIGCPLPEADMEKLTGVDVLLIPVGGFYTIDAAQADAIARRCGARVVIPMHYRTDKSGFDVIAPVEDFLKMRDNIVYCGDSARVSRDSAGATLVLNQLQA